jgi:dihydroorotase
MSLLIFGGTVIDPASDVHARLDVLVANGHVAEVAEPGRLNAKAEQRLDASGCWVVPGLIDIHVHLREPGYEYKETVASGAQAAVAGGFTAVACMANTNPVNDNAAVTEYILERAHEANLARVYPIGAVSMGLNGERLAEIGEMREAGIVAVSDDGMPVRDSALMRRALEYSSMFDLPVIAHEEDCGLASGGVMNEGAVSFRLGLKGMPAAAEEVMVARDIALVERTGGRLHIAHVSTAGSIHLIREAKARGLPVSAEAAPHHFTLTEEAVASYDTNAKMNPPLRTAADVEAVIGALRDGTIEVIASDHAPHHRDEKEIEFEQAANGIIGLETTLPLSLRLIRDAGISIETVVAALTANPARVLGVPCGRLTPGGLADLAVIDPDCPWTVDPNHFHSKSRNTPFAGWQMVGAARATIVGGRVVWQQAETAAPRKKRSAKR